MHFTKAQVIRALKVLKQEDGHTLGEDVFEDESRPFTKLCEDWLALNSGLSGAE